jgi:hypothetical protein
MENPENKSPQEEQVDKEQLNIDLLALRQNIGNNRYLYEEYQNVKKYLLAQTGESGVPRTHILAGLHAKLSNPEASDHEKGLFKEFQKMIIDSGETISSRLNFNKPDFEQVEDEDLVNMLSAINEMAVPQEDGSYSNPAGPQLKEFYSSLEKRLTEEMDGAEVDMSIIFSELYDILMNSSERRGNLINHDKIAFKELQKLIIDNVNIKQTA